MGKILKTVLVVVGLAALAFATAGGSIGVSITGVGVAGGNVAVAAAISSSTIAVIGSGLLVASSLIPGRKPKIDVAGDQGTILRLSKDPTAPRTILYGKSASGGNMVYQEAVGTDNSDLYVVIVLSGHEIESFESFEWAGTPITFTGNNADGNFNNFMFLYEHLGTDAQTVNTTLDAASAKWTTNHRLRGIAYAVLKLVWDAEKFPQGFQAAKFTLKGRKIYDPRKDSTNGGAGTHRLTDQSTWEWSDNSVLALVDYLRGIRVANSATTSYDGQLIAGMGIADTRINWANIRAEADVCDESVTIKAGGSENRYTCNGWINPERPHKTNVEAILSSMAGVLVFQSGKWNIYTGTTRTAIKSRTTDEIVGGVAIQTKKSIRDKINSVRGVFPDAAKGYEAADYPPRQNSTYITEDGSEELWLDLNLPLTTSGSTAQRLAKIALERARRELTAQLAFNLTALQDQAMDAITFTHAPLNLSSQKFLIADWSLKAVAVGENIGLMVEETLIEEADAIYDWTAATDETTIPAQGTQTRVDTNEPGAITNMRRGEPPGMHIGGVGDVWFIPNELSSGTANDGEIHIKGISYYHPDGTKRTITNDREVLTNYEGAGQRGTFYVVYTDTAPATRFPGWSGGNSNEFFHATYDWEIGQWTARDNTAAGFDFTPVATDALVAVGFRNDTDAGLTSVSSRLSANQNLPADGATVGADWGGNLANRPAELTDGRVAIGLTAAGDVNRNVPVGKITEPGITQHQAAIDALALTNAPAQAGADVTDDHAQNFISNPGMESGIGNWSNSPSEVTIVNDPGNAFSGDWVMKFDADGLTTWNTKNSKRTATKAGERWFASCMIKGGTAGGDAFVHPIQRTSGGAASSMTIINRDVVAAGGGYSLSRGVFEVTGSNVKVEAGIQSDGTVTGTWYADQFVLVPLPKDSDIDVLLTINAPAEAGADVTGSNTAAAITGQGALATLGAAAWATQVSGRPAELTDGRVATGLTAAGDVNRNVPVGKITEPSITQHQAAIDALALTNAPAQAGADVTENIFKTADESTDNIIKNGSFGSGAQSTDMDNVPWWKNPGADPAEGWDEILAASGLTDSANAPSQFVGKSTPQANDNTFAFVNNGTAFPVLPGETIRYQCEVNDNGTAVNVNFTIIITWLDETKAFDSVSGIAQSTVAVWTPISITAVAPATARYFRLSWSTANSATPSGDWYAGGWKASRVIDFANEITGAEKPADNADVTADNAQAVGWLTDAGALATLDDVDWPTLVVGVGKPTDFATGGGSLVRGTAFRTTDEWFSNNNGTGDISTKGWTIITGVGGPIGNNALQIIDNDNSSESIFSERVPIDPTKTYRVSVSARQPSGDRKNYLLVGFFKADGTLISGGGSGWSGTGTYNYWRIVNAAFPTIWTDYSFIFGPNIGADATMPTDAAFMGIGGLFTRDGPVGTNTTVQLQGLRVDEVDDRALAALTGGGNVAAGVAQDQGDQTFRQFLFGGADLYLNDGDSPIYENGWQNPPLLWMGSGGLTTDSGLTGDVNQQFVMQNPTASGADASLRIVELSGVPTVVHETTNGASGQDFSKIKSGATIAWDNKYTIQYDVTVGKATGPPGEPEPTTVVVEFYYKDGGAGWVLIGSTVHLNSNQNNTKVLTNVTKTFVVTGVAQNDDFGISKGTEIGNPSTLVGMDEFFYETATAPADNPATLATTGEILLRVLGPDSGGLLP